jgi:hypothetical protein
MGFGLGLTYERLIKGNFSIGVHFESVVVDEMMHFGADAHGRWYPLEGASLEKLFIDAGLGYARLLLDGTTMAGGITVSLKAGCKVPMGSKIFIEPAIGYTLAKATNGFGPGGLGIGLSIGAKF